MAYGNFMDTFRSYRVLILGIISGVKEGKLIDKIIRGYCYILMSTPTFWLGILFIMVFSVSLGWFPVALSVPIGVVSSQVSLVERIQHIILPALTLSVISISSMCMYTREKVLEIMKKNGIESSIPYDLELERYARYAEQQERLISPEGTFPIVGRSLAYRFGAFHALSDVAYRKLLPERVKPAQVRSALSAIINRQVNAPGTFNPEGWLRVGFAGYQPHIGETYISTGSLYLCTAVFIALGLPESDEFWSSPSADWTCKKGWAGVDLNVDKALKK